MLLFILGVRLGYTLSIRELRSSCKYLLLLALRDILLGCLDPKHYEVQPDIFPRASTGISTKGSIHTSSTTKQGTYSIDLLPPKYSKTPYICVLYTPAPPLVVGIEPMSALAAIKHRSLHLPVSTAITILPSPPLSTQIRVLTPSSAPRNCCVWNHISRRPHSGHVWPILASVFSSSSPSFCTALCRSRSADGNAFGFVRVVITVAAISARTCRVSRRGV